MTSANEDRRTRAATNACTERDPQSGRRPHCIIGRCVIAQPPSQGRQRTPHI
ncbi:hypothetical protein RRSWK_05136 [Rhodopirellula sp. SWK7]|nr:hypothetical protein RRSWK_05136 [Rhodopirellula sp. SWK7]